MYINEWEQEKLWIFVLAKLAEERKARGMKLNIEEAIAVITYHVTEEARTGKYTVSDLQRMGHQVLDENDVMDSVPDLVKLINIQVVMPDGNKLVVVNNPFKPAEHPEWGELPPGYGSQDQHGNH
ncbi:urease subunit gamma [Scopulibacillus darangshiensis]|uniref:Urease subunit gamma n=1 Tax=Scopulibacillus darangshiensis TaxID=442528 RepID=A0A4R2NL08_9BACL|nr:urease subunit gamma [Scopulibacillus darangshiensis]TCP21945.1 urease subunit gamma [Scopulibacillus darangshiensis]